MNNHATALYDKLNNVHSSLRKQKEDAYRSKQLAEQRLALARQDREAFEKKGVEMKNQLRQLKENAVQMKAGNSKLEVECKHVEKEANFQHAELQSKKEKLSRLQDKRNIEANNRHHSLTSGRELLRRLREDSSKNDNSNNHNAVLSSTEEKRHKLEQLMEMDGGVELCKNLPELVRLRKEQKMEDYKEAESRNAALRRIIAGYQNALGGGADTMDMMIVQNNNMMEEENPILQQ